MLGSEIGESTASYAPIERPSLTSSNTGFMLGSLQPSPTGLFSASI